MKLSELELNLDHVDGGVWVDEIPYLEGVRFRVRGSSFAPYKKALNKAMVSQSRYQRGPNQVDVEKFDALTRTLMNEHLLLDWDGIEDNMGAPLPYSPDLAKRFMTERVYEPVQRGVLYAIDMVDKNAVERREDIAGN